MAQLLGKTGRKTANSANGLIIEIVMPLTMVFSGTKLQLHSILRVMVERPWNAISMPEENTRERHEPFVVPVIWSFSLRRNFCYK